MAQAPVGTCYPSDQTQAFFTRKITITLAILLQNVTYAKTTSQCEGSQNPLWQHFHTQPWAEFGISTFTIELRFSINPAFQLGDPPNTKYSCMNIQEYTNTFNSKNAQAEARGRELAQQEARTLPPTIGSCDICVNGKKEKRSTKIEKKVEAVSKTEVKQVIARGCGP